MNQYIFKGLILPERALISFGPFDAELMPLVSKNSIAVKINVVLNQLTIWVYSNSAWDIYDLRNIVKTWATSIIAVFGFVLGHAYEVTINQVLNEKENIDYVFGIDTPCIKERNKEVDLNTRISEILNKTSGEFGIYISRSFNDLLMALKHHNDTFFYCFRAIEALKQYCKYKFEIEKEKDQWKKVCEISGFNKKHIETIREKAFPARHGDGSAFTSEDRANALNKTWDVVESFIEKI